MTGRKLTTSMTYRPSGQINALTATNADTAQVTAYNFGSTLTDSAVASNELLVDFEYTETELARHRA